MLLNYQYWIILELQIGNYTCFKLTLLYLKNKIKITTVPVTYRLK